MRNLLEVIHNNEFVFDFRDPNIMVVEHKLINDICHKIKFAYLGNIYKLTYSGFDFDGYEYRKFSASWKNNRVVLFD